MTLCSEEYGPGMPTPVTFSRADRIDGDGGGERRIDAAAEADDHALKAALVDVIARAR